MTTPKNVMKMIKDNDVKYVDFRFTDPRGKWQHVTFDVSMIEEETFAEGQMFDGSSIAGGVAGIDLMEQAGRAGADAVLARHPAGSRVIVVAGREHRRSCSNVSGAIIGRMPTLIAGPFVYPLLALGDCALAV